MANKKTILTEDIINDICNYYISGYSISCTAKSFHISRKYVQEILESHNIAIRTKAMQHKLMIDNIKKTINNKYGVDNVFQLEETKLKIKKTCLIKYGVEAYSQSDSFKQQTQENWQNKTEEELSKIINKRKQTLFNLYGVEHAAQAPEIKDKIANTNIERYGVPTVLQDSIKMKNAIIEKYGVENVFQASLIKEKSKQTMLTKYGVEHFFQSELNMSKSVYKKYVYEDEYFDSLPELAIWLYMINNNIEIKRNSKKFLYYFDNNQHYCFPDFEIAGKLVEVKGDHLFKKMLIPNTIDNAKYQCLLENNIEIWTSKEYYKYLNWFYKKGYNKNDFKRKS